MTDTVFNWHSALESGIKKDGWAELIKRLGCKIDVRVERASPACEGEFIDYFAMYTDDELRQLEQEWDQDHPIAQAKGE